MSLEARVGKGEARPIAVEERSDGGLKVVLGGAEVSIAPVELQPGLWLLNVGGRIIEAGVSRVGEKLEVSLGGRVLPVEIGDPRRRALSGAAGRKAGPTDVISPMPGKVIGVLVEVGQQVKEGQGLVVVEAMKMENEYKAPRDGRVGAISVAAGDTIEAGARLLRLEPLPAEA